MSYPQMSKYSKTTEELKKYIDSGCSKKEAALAEWRNVKTLLSNKNFHEMLDHLNLSESEFSTIIDIENLEAVHYKEKWEKKLEDILNNYSYSEKIYKNKIIEPFILYAIKGINVVIEKCISLRVESKVLRKMEHVIEEELFNISGKVLAIELDNFKVANNYSEQNSTTSDVFFKKLMHEKFSNKQGYLNFFESYPTLARILTVRTEYLLGFFTEILFRTNFEKDNILEFLKESSDDLVLENVDLSIGDSHKQGRSVCILNFNVGNVVYKPKNLEINEEIKKFTDWFTKSCGLLDIKFPKGLYREEYTYIEYIEYIKCESEKEIKDFYTRFGYLIALTYMFNITDMHMENLISHGEYPIIVDIETSFQNVSPITDSLYLKLFELTDLNSVKLSGLLPNSIEIEAGNESIDLSALVGKQRKMQHKILKPVNIGTDAFHYSDVHGTYSPSGNNIPKNKSNKNIDYKQYRNNIIEGFEEFFKNMLSKKDSILNKINEFKNCKTRVLLKGTDKYHSLIKISDHPNYNRKMKYRERFLMNIWSYPYKDKRAIKSEMKDLLHNDIPIFETYIKSTDIFDSFNNRYPNYFEKCGFDIVKKKIFNLSENEFLYQKDILITTLGLADDYFSDATTLKKPNEKLYYSENDERSKEIENYISNYAIVFENQKSFVNLNCGKLQKWAIEPANESLYDGVSGIALTYLLLFIVYKEEKYYENYKFIMRHAIYLAEKHSVVNAFQGLLSPLYPIILEKKYLGTSVFENFITNVSTELLKLTNNNVDILNRDFIAGTSGILNLVHSAQLIFGNDMFPQKIIEYLSKDLLNTLKSKSVEAGIAHGISGMVLSLIKANYINEDDALYYLTYEDTLKIPCEDKYKWCRGVTGKLQARLKILDFNKNLKEKIDIHHTINEFEKNLKYIPQDDCLCHGTSGIISTLKVLYKFTNNNKWLNYMNIFCGNVYTNQLIDDYNITKMKTIKSLGLFNGLTGILCTNLFIHHDIVNIQTLEV